MSRRREFRSSGELARWLAAEHEVEEFGRLARLWRFGRLRMGWVRWRDRRALRLIGRYVVPPEELDEWVRDRTERGVDDRL